MLTLSWSHPSECTATSFVRPRADFRTLARSGVEFRVHRMNLMVHSPVFRDMFEIGSEVKSGGEGQLARVELVEKSSALEIALDYIYPRHHEFTLDFPSSWMVVQVFVKYEVSFPVAQRFNAELDIGPNAATDHERSRSRPQGAGVSSTTV